jgi:2-polyprenyl-6-methoxyphenol hydroxylase-like FAD-dependent oxidoreductase
LFDMRLIEAAERAGVAFRPGTITKLADAQAESRLVVLATGLNSEAVPERGSRIGAGVMVPAVAAPAFFEPGTIFIGTGRGGYVGLVRVESSQLDVAAAFDPGFVKQSGGLGPAAEAILGEVGWPVPSGLAEFPWKGTPALTRRRAKLADHRLFVVGDAAGYVEPFTGEGMAWALASAAALAPIGARDWTPNSIREWEATHRRVLGRRQLGCRIVARALRSPAFTRIAVRALSVFPVLARPLVAALNRSRRITHAAPA